MQEQTFDTRLRLKTGNPKEYRMQNHLRTFEKGAVNHQKFAEQLDAMGRLDKEQCLSDMRTIHLSKMGETRAYLQDWKDRAASITPRIKLSDVSGVSSNRFAIRRAVRQLQSRRAASERHRVARRRLQPTWQSAGGAVAYSAAIVAPALPIEFLRRFNCPHHHGQAAGGLQMF